MGAAPLCERRHWGLRWNSIWGHDPREGCADMGAGDDVDDDRDNGDAAADLRIAVHAAESRRRRPRASGRPSIGGSKMWF